MGKQLVRSLQSMSLAKQLMMILAMIGIVIVILVIPLMENNMIKIVGNQMIENITDQQESLMMISDSKAIIDYDVFERLRQKNDNIEVSHFIYYPNKGSFRNLSNLTSESAVTLQKNVFNYYLANQIDNNIESKSYHTIFNQRDVYFVITANQQHQEYWISFTFHDISDGLLNALRNELVYILYGVIVLIAFALSLWVYTLIRPLKDIEGYIEKVKLGKPRELNVNRNDEIGRVSLALLNMDTELEKQDQLKSDLIHNISHDLKTPIAIIRSYSESMKEDIYPYGDKNSSLDIIIENANRLEKKVKDFLYLNRLDYLEEKNADSISIDIYPIIANLIDELSPMHPELKINLEFDSFMMHGEEEHWYSAIMNILDNACRYANSEIRIMNRNGDLIIYNDGSHVDQSVMNDLFKPYAKGPKGNFGLGMSIVYKIVHLYGYSIYANNLDNGVAFIISKKEKPFNKIDSIS